MRLNARQPHYADDAIFGQWISARDSPGDRQEYSRRRGGLDPALEQSERVQILERLGCGTLVPAADNVQRDVTRRDGALGLGKLQDLAPGVG